MEIAFRPMERRDIPRVAELERICFRSPWSESALRGELKNRLAHYLVMCDGEAVVGYAGMWTLFDEAHITNVAVQPEYRGNGLGRRLMRRMMGQALRLGAARMTLEVREGNAVAQSLYYSLGFQTAGRRKRYYSDTGEDALILWNDCIAAYADGGD